jgi:hypothetical protein
VIIAFEETRQWRPAARAVPAIALMAVLFVVSIGRADPNRDPNRDPEVAKSLQTTPWYDADRRQLVPLAVQPRQDDSVHRGSRWLPKPKTIRKPRLPDTNATTADDSQNGLFGTSWTLSNIFGWVLLAVTLLGIVGVIVYAISRAELSLSERRPMGSNESATDGLPDRQTLERIKHLPPELRRTDVNLRTECERMMDEGKLDQAIILLLGHQLLLLDRCGMLRLGRGKTNGRYVRETRLHDERCAVWLRATADAFEQSYFGRHDLSPDVFEELWRQNEMLESAAPSFGAHS